MNRTSHPSLFLFVYVITGFAAGVLNGLLGAAGGILLVAVLPALTTTHTTALSPALSDRRDLLATALCVMLPTSAISLLLYLWRGIRPPVSALLVMIIPAAIGGLIGAFLLDRIPRSTLKRGFALIVIISGFRMLLG